MKIAIVGAGLIGTKRSQVFKTHQTNDNLVAIIDIDKDKAKALASQHNCDAFRSLEEAIQKKGMDIVIVATPNRFLMPTALTALSNKKHVLCEKPLGRNVEESLSMVNEAKRNGVLLKTGFNHRHHPALQQAKQLIGKSEIGEIYYIRCIYGHGGRPGYEEEWRADKDMSGGGELLDQGVHVVDLFRWFLGEFDEVYGQIGTMHWNMEVEDNAFALFKTPKKQIAVMHTSWTQWKNKFLFEIYAENGYMEVDGLGGSYGTEKLILGKRKLKAGAPQEFLGGPPDVETLEFSGPDISWEEEWKEFVSAIKENRSPQGSGYDGLMANKLIAALYQSAQLNQPQKIGDTP